MNAKAVYESLEKKFPDKVSGFKDDVLDPVLHVAREAIVEVSQFLRDDPDLKFEVLSDLAGLDLPKEEKIQVVYHLYSYIHEHSIVLKVDLPRKEPEVATVEGVWKAANWMEREVFDLFGVDIKGHSDLRRILLPEDWVGHPLRKDYVEQEEYDGVSTEREALVKGVLR